MSTGQQTKGRVAVIGGGMGGLAAAYELLQAGEVDVTVYERGARAGGILCTSREHGFVREHAANGFLPVKDGSGALDLAQALGVEIAEAAPAAKNRWIYRHGKLHALPAGPGAFVKTELLSWRGKLALFAEPFRPRGSGEDESIVDFVSRRLGREVAEALVTPFVTGIFAGNADELSVQSGFPTLAALEARGGLLVGQLRNQMDRLVRRIKEGQPDTAKTASRGRRRMRMAAPAGGVQALSDALAAALGDRLVTNAAVQAIKPGPTVAFAGEREHGFDAVVLATPAHVSAELVVGLSGELSGELLGVPYAPVAIAYLGVRRADMVHPLDGFGFLVAPGEDVRMLGCVFESVLWPERAPADMVLLRCIFGGARDPSVLELDDRALIETARADLDRAIGNMAGVELVHTHVVRHERAIAQYKVGHGERVARAESLAEPLGIILAGSAYHGVAVNSLVADRKRVSTAVMSRLQAVLATLLVLLLVGCANGPKGAEPSTQAAAADTGDPQSSLSATFPGGATTTSAVADPAGAGTAGVEQGSNTAGGDTGEVAITVTWRDAPAELRGPLGRNGCGTWRRAPVSVDTLGGVRNTVVRLQGNDPGQDTAGPEPGPGAGEEQTGAGRGEPVEMAVRACAVEPPVVLVPSAGTDLVVINEDEERRRVVVDRATGQDALAVDLPVAGARAAVAMGEPGMFRVRATVDPAQAAYAVVPAGPYVALTDGRGAVEFARVPAGAYDAVVWHPPVKENAPPIEVRQPIVVAARETTRVTIPLSLR